MRISKQEAEYLLPVLEDRLKSMEAYHKKYKWIDDADEVAQIRRIVLVSKLIERMKGEIDGNKKSD
jgi:hypothetical protein